MFNLYNYYILVSEIASIDTIDYSSYSMSSNLSCRVNLKGGTFIDLRIEFQNDNKHAHVYTKKEIFELEHGLYYLSEIGRLREMFTICNKNIQEL